MGERISFYLDENVDPDIARALHRQSITVTTAVEAGLRSAQDIVHLNFIREHGYVIVTHDADFLRLASGDNNHPGIAYCHKESLSIGEIIRSLILIHQILTPEDMIGHIEYL
jgi:predicted nuclease of predicted toxin-antitoxin system